MCYDSSFGQIAKIVPTVKFVPIIDEPSKGSKVTIKSVPYKSFNLRVIIYAVVLLVFPRLTHKQLNLFF